MVFPVPAAEADDEEEEDEPSDKEEAAFGASLREAAAAFGSPASPGAGSSIGGTRTKRRSVLGLRDFAGGGPMARALASAVAVGRRRRGRESSDDVEGLSPEDSVDEDKDERESAAAGLGEDE